MWLKIIKKRDKKALDSLAMEFSNSILNNSGGNHKVIGLYGTKNKKILYFFKDKLRNYFLQKGKDIQIKIGTTLDDINPDNIDLGYFFRAYKALGLNPHYLINN